MKASAPGSFGVQLKALRVAAGFTQEELATIAGLSVHAVSALERGERRRPHVDTVRALSAALDLTAASRDAFMGSARASIDDSAADELSELSLPLVLTALLGREADVATLRQWLSEPATRLITLVGPGGVGKTRLALELAHAAAAESKRRVLFVPLAAIRNPSFVASAIAEALGLSDVSAVDLPRRARTACDDRPTLLMLDNFEQVLDAAPLVADLIASVASLRLLVTSRAPLRIRGEREYAVGPLALDPGTSSVEDLSRSPAVRLFVERVQDIQPGFRLSAANIDTVTAICQRLDALPLALELAAPWIKVLTPEDLLHRLSQDVLLAAVDGPRDLPERQRTINATVAWSYQLLGPREQRAFRRLAVLPGRFPIDAADAVLAENGARSVRSGEALGAAAELIDRSLLQRAETSVPIRPLYQMLETVRAFAALELATSTERDDAMQGLAFYCESEAARAAVGLVGPTQVEWLNRVRDDLESYRAALAWLIERGRPVDAADISWWLKYFWLIRGHAIEGLQWYEQILSMTPLPPAAESRTLVGAATMWYTQGELGRARAALDRALALADHGGDMEIAAHAENLSAHVDHAFGNIDDARARFTRSAAAFRTMKSPAGIGNALSGMAAVTLATGNADQAEQLLDEAAVVLRQAGPWFLTWALYVRAILDVRRGRPDEAIGLIRESLTRIRDLHDKFAFVYALVPLAAAAALKGDDVWAARILGTRDVVTERTGVTVADKSVLDLRARAEREARARLSPERWTRAYAAGRNASIDSLLEDIDHSRR
jgi:predicted ATPase/DNA-binding XRE family transcriptional regulator